MSAHKVPDSFSIGCLTPIPNKKKLLSGCSSFRSVKVATLFCKIFEKLIIDEIRSKYAVHVKQFGFQSRLAVVIPFLP